MTTEAANPSRFLWLLLIISLSLPLKLAAAQHMPFDIDIIPVLSRTYEWLQGGAFPAVGTLSSVGAYNMPMLQWLHLPAMLALDNAWWVILLTMLAFNIVSTVAIFCVGEWMFGTRAGLIAAALFTFSETGISSSYTAWAQLLLPGFYSLTLLFLWQWQHTTRGYYLALAGVVATAAFMTHFSAILLYPAMLVFALLSRSRWQWGWLLAGALACLLLLMPYMRLQIERDFVDVRAFITREPLPPAAVIAQYSYLKPGARSAPVQDTDSAASTDASAPPQPTPPNNAASRPPAPSRSERIIAFALSVPAQYGYGANLGFSVGTRGYDALAPVFSSLLWGLMQGLRLVFWLTIVWALWRFVRSIQSQKPITLATVLQGFTSDAAGRVLLLCAFAFTILTGMILTRSMEQATYFTGLESLRWLIIAAGLVQISDTRWIKRGVLVLLVLYMGLMAGERAARLLTHDATVYSRFAVSIYPPIAQATDFIAADWAGEERITVQYDIVPEMRNLWWVAPWHSVDPTYRYGLNFDFLLAYHHGLSNTVTHPLGEADNPDYIIVYEPGLSRWNLADYDVAQFGSIYVLKPVGT